MECKRTASAGFLLLMSGLCAAQVQSVPSREAEMAQLATLYFIDVSRGDWKQVQIDPCPAFTHHVFTRYERSAAPGVISSFLAIYPLNAAPGTPSKPWKSGIFLIPAQTFGIKPQPLVERRTTRLVFNQVWADELKEDAQLGHFPLSWGGLADCYAAMASERPIRFSTVSSDVPPAPEIDLKTNPVSSIIITVDGGSAPHSLRLAVDPRGMITDASLR